MVKYGRYVTKTTEGTPEAIMLFDNLVDAVSPGEKVEIFNVTIESLGNYSGKFEVVKVGKPRRKGRAKKVVDSVTTKSKPGKRKYTKKSKFWGKKK